MILKRFPALIIAYFLFQNFAIGWSQEHEHVRYLPHFTQKQGQWQTTLGLYNPSSTSTHIHLEAYGKDGVLLGEKTMNLPGQSDWSGSLLNLLGNLDESTGWIRLSSNDPAISGTVTFRSVIGQGRTSLPLDQGMSQGLIFPLLESTTDRQSGIVLVNPNSTPCQVALRISGLNRQHEQVHDITLNPRSKFVAMLSETFPQPLPERVSLEVTADQPVLGFGLTFQNGNKQIVAAPPTVWDPGFLPELRQMVNRAHQQAQRSTGISIALDSPQTGTLIAAAGHADIEQGIAMQVDTISEIASITKTMVAALFLRFQEDGLLNLDDPVEKFMPDFPKGADISLRYLLNHHSGLPEVTTLPRWLEAVIAAAEDGSPAWTPQRTLAEILKEPFDFEPGSEYRYSNTNYLVLAMIAEQLAQKPFGHQLREQFWEPLGMNNTFMANLEETRERAQSYLYEASEDRLINISDFDMNWFWNSSTVSSAQDLLTWTKALYSGTVLTPASMEQMLTPGPANQEEAGARYGLGTNMINAEGSIFLGHDGRNFGSFAQTYYFPEIDTTFSLLINTDTMEEVYEILFNEILERFGQTAKRLTSAQSKLTPGKTLLP